MCDTCICSDSVATTFCSFLRAGSGLARLLITKSLCSLMHVVLINIFEIRQVDLQKEQWRIRVMKEKKWRHLREISSSKLQRTITATVGSRSINRALGTCFPAPVSQTKVFKASTVVSLSRNQNKDTINFFAKPKKEPSNPQRIEKFCTKVNQTNGFVYFFLFLEGLVHKRKRKILQGKVYSHRMQLVQWETDVSTQRSFYKLKLAFSLGVLSRFSMFRAEVPINLKKMPK